jgi:hypothetical protein
MNYLVKYLCLVFVIGLSAAAYALTGTSPPVNLQITITPSAPPPPPPPPPGGVPTQAANAGFSTLAYNFDFSQPQYGNPTTNWIDCSYPPTDGSKVWHQASPGVPSFRCDATVFSQTTDQGFTVLDERWDSADDGKSSGNGSFNSIQTVTRQGTGQGGTPTAQFPNFFIETVYRIDALGSGSGVISGPDGVWTWQTGGSQWEWDIAELYGSSGGFGDECGQQCTWVSYNAGIGGNQNIPSGWSPFNYHKYGMLVTSDGVNATYGCGWIDDVFQNCFNRGISNFPQWLIMWVGGTGANATQLPTTNQYIQYVRVWSCAAWQTTQCNGSTLSSSTVNGAPFNYYH